MRRSSFHPARSITATAALLSLLGNPSIAQTTASPAPSENDRVLPGITVTAPASRAGVASISGFDSEPAWRTPVQAQRFDEVVLKDARVQRLADLVELDASTTDAYNTTGYWDSLSVRGFTLDNAYNYRREGLPISAETRLPLDNKSAVELFKGTSGIQAGVSAPGGLVNLLVKRPEGRIRHAALGLTGGSSVLAAVDVGDRWGAEQQFGLRLNAAAERLAPDIENARGHRHLLAVATDWTLAPGSVLQAEFEHSRQRQPSVPGASLLGSQLPSAGDFDPARNLNQQPWVQPVALQGNTGSLRWQQAWGQGWSSKVTYGEQRLRSEDPAAFPSGCAATGQFDRYCPDGSFDLYDYRSLGERRITRALDAQVSGEVVTGSVKHALSFGMLRALHRTSLNTANFDYVGEGTLYGDIPAFPASTLPPSYAGLNRSERSTEFSVSDALTSSDAWRAWAGLRHTRLHRTAQLSEGGNAARLDQSVTTPWVAVGYALAERTQAYASWGEGFEAKFALNNPLVSYENNGDVLPARKSRQIEVGLKGQRGQHDWSVNWFRIVRPEAGPVAGPANPSYVWDGDSLHQGLEGSWQGRYGAWTVYASAMVLDTERRGSANADTGEQPVNVPAHTLKLSTQYRLALSLPTTLDAQLIHEGRRWADPANQVRVPSWTRVDVGLKAVQRLPDSAGLTWRLGVSNLFDRRAWREAPTLTGHIYLFPMAARTLTASAEVDF